MSCASCVGRVEKSLRAVPGVGSVSVNLATEQASVDGDASLDARALAAAVRKAGYGVESRLIDLQIDDMSCASCVGRVEKALLKVPGVESATVNLATERAQVQVLGAVDAAALAAAVGRAGYPARAVAAASAGAARRAGAACPQWWPVALAVC